VIAARKGQVGDLIIIISYATDHEEIPNTSLLLSCRWKIITSKVLTKPRYYVDAENFSVIILAAGARNPMNNPEQPQKF
jgi:hypothetical protein